MMFLALFMLAGIALADNNIYVHVFDAKSCLAVANATVTAIGGHPKSNLTDNNGVAIWDGTNIAKDLQQEEVDTQNSYIGPGSPPPIPPCKINFTVSKLGYSNKSFVGAINSSKSFPVNFGVMISPVTITAPTKPY